MTQHNLLAVFGVLVLGLCLVMRPAQATPVLQPGAVVNAASFKLAGAPNSAIARGSIFTVFGQDIGPQILVSADTFPLPQELGGTSIRISAGGLDWDAVMLYTSSGQAAAVLPSAVPAGEAELVVTYNNEASNPIAFQVADHQPGLFTRLQNGAGAAVLQNYISDSQLPVNAINQAMQPGQVGILWATGLGAAIDGDDRNPGAAGNVIDPSRVSVYVGGKPAPVEYAGRSPCCSGVDQINFVLPEDATPGCHVSVAAVVDGVASNSATIAVDGSGEWCDRPFGVTDEQMAESYAKMLDEMLADRLRMNVKTLRLARERSDTPSGTAYSEVGSASFSEVDGSGFLLDSSGAIGETNPLANGSCVVTVLPLQGSVPIPYHRRFLDAGPELYITGPAGERTMPKIAGREGVYRGTFFQGTDINLSYLLDGDYTVHNGEGGADIGGGEIGNFLLPQWVHDTQDHLWSNRDIIDNIKRAQPLPVTWDPWDPVEDGSGTEALWITMQSWSVPKNVATVLDCFADPTLGEFTIPEHVLNSMVPSDGGGVSTGGAMFVKSSAWYGIGTQQDPESVKEWRALFLNTYYSDRPKPLTVQ